MKCPGPGKRTGDHNTPFITGANTDEDGKKRKRKGVVRWGGGRQAGKISVGCWPTLSPGHYLFRVRWLFRLFLIWSPASCLSFSQAFFRPSRLPPTGRSSWAATAAIWAKMTDRNSNLLEIHVEIWRQWRKVKTGNTRLPRKRQFQTVSSN